MPEHNETILDQILTELRALQVEVSERLLFIEQRVSTQTQVKHFERRMIDIEDKAQEVRNK